MSVSLGFVAVAVAGLAGVATVSQLLRKRAMRAAPRITLDEVETLWAGITAAALPVASVILDSARPGMASQSRIGGTPFVMGDEVWPVSAEDGRPMLFLAQINFAEVPRMEDFPSFGLLQLFVEADDRGFLGATDGPEGRVLRWFPDPRGTATLAVPATFLSLKKRGALSAHALHNGLSLRFQAGMAVANPHNWPFDAAASALFNRLPETPEVEARLVRFWEEADQNSTGHGTHSVGGHPTFVQNDIRAEEGFQGLDRVLLQLGADDNIEIGDSGQLNLMISQADLKACNFQKALCYWDCS